MLLSLLRQSVCIRADLIAEMTQAVEGWIWGFRFECIVDSRRESDWTIGWRRACKAEGRFAGLFEGETADVDVRDRYDVVEPCLT